MFTCSACMERCLQGLIGSPVISSSSSLRTALTTQFSRNYSNLQPPAEYNPNTQKYLRNKSANFGKPEPKYPPEDLKKGDFNYDGSKWDREAKPNARRTIIPNSYNRLVETGGVALHRKEYQLEKSMGNVLRKHPEYANDPLKLAEYVRKALKGDDFETALAVVRAASKQLSCTVSWNHLIDWQMTKGKMNGSLKTYNEMKKRGQIPDAHTFTIIIRGCTEHRDLTQALGKVMAIYNAMLADKSPVKPNTIHMNAILKMCARAKDMDAMFGIVAQMPSKGITAPNNLTFTTILNALRQNAAGDFRSTLTPVQKRQNAQKAILDGRQIWQDITNRWRKGEIWIDEELVCAMGRLMLLGGERDNDDILSLIDQAMNIPRQIPRMTTPERNKIAPSSQGRENVQEPESPPVKEVMEEESEAVMIGAIKSARTDSFKSLTPAPNPTSAGKSAYAKPGRNTLSLILEALRVLKLKEPAFRYWDIMVNKIGVHPDIENYHAYLRILRISRSSSETVELLESMNATEMRTSTFRIAMASCERDRNNPNAFANAGKILDIMSSALRVPDIPVLTTYLDIATTGTNKLSQLASGKQILRALDRLGPSFINLRSLLLLDSPSRNSHNAPAADFQSDVARLTRRMVGAYDLLMDKALVPRDTYSTLSAERNKLSSFVSRHHNQSQTQIPKPPGSYDLSPELQAYVDRQQLNKIMVRAQISPEKWELFTRKVTQDFENEKKQIEVAREMQEQSSVNARESAKVVEDERQAADALVKALKEYGATA